MTDREALALEREMNHEVTVVCTSPQCGLIFDVESEEGVLPDCVLCESPTERHKAAA